VLKAAARQRLVAGEEELDLGLERTEPAKRGTDGGPLPITSSRMGHLWGALAHAYDELGFGHATGRDEVFRQLVLARIIEPASKLDSLRVPEEAGVAAASYRTLKRRLPVFADPAWRAGHAPGTRAWARRAWCSTTSARCISRPASGRGSARAGSPRNAAWTRRSPSGCSPTRSGFPLLVCGFEGNMVETKTMLPVDHKALCAQFVGEMQGPPTSS
jgi:hypothetical protein